MLYTVQAPNDVVALDAATGRVFWTYSHTPAADARTCCGRVNRGLAILGDTLFMGTIDAHLLAIDAKSGQLLWDTVVAEAAERYSITHAPLVVKDKVIVGTAGGDMGIRGFIAAYDVKTGSEVWRFYTIPGPGEPGNDTWSGDSWKTGGAGVWNTAPTIRRRTSRSGAPAIRRPTGTAASGSATTCTATASSRSTPTPGSLKWHYQFTPHDELDYDSTQVPVLADIQWQGAAAQGDAVGQPQRRHVRARPPHGRVPDGQAVREGELDGRLRREGPPAARAGHGAHARGHADPAARARRHQLGSRRRSARAPACIYVAHWENSGIMVVEGQFPRAARGNPAPDDDGPDQPPHFYNNDDEAYGVVRAYDPATLEPKWEFKMSDITWGGVLTTAGDLVFGGGKEGYFFALDARTGALLWKAALGGQVNAGP